MALPAVSIHVGLLQAPRSTYPVCFWKWSHTATETQDGDEPKTGSHLLFTRGNSAFNAAQVDGYTPKVEPDVPMPDRIERAERFFRGAPSLLPTSSDLIIAEHTVPRVS